MHCLSWLREECQALGTRSQMWAPIPPGQGEDNKGLVVSNRLVMFLHSAPFCELSCKCQHASSGDGPHPAAPLTLDISSVVAEYQEAFKLAAPSRASRILSPKFHLPVPWNQGSAVPVPYCLGSRTIGTIGACIIWHLEMLLSSGQNTKFTLLHQMKHGSHARRRELHCKPRDTD